MEENKEDWVELFSERWQKPYWKNKVTGEKTWKRPTWISSSSKVVGNPPISPECVSLPSVSPPLSPPESPALSPTHAWVERYSEKRGKKYWKNTVTGEATWKNPDLIDSYSHDSSN